jgi:hypothetical protein
MTFKLFKLSSETPENDTSGKDWKIKEAATNSGNACHSETAAAAPIDHSPCLV